MNRSRHSTPSYFIAWAVIALFYFYQYILRVSPGIMVIELKETFQLTAQSFSSLGSIYLLSYSLLQIPLGFILDWIGVRRVALISVAFCIFGTLLFTYATELWMLQLGRFLLGLGSAPAFICALKLINDHLPKKWCGLLMGITLSIGTFGALFSGKFLIVLLETKGWQNALLNCALGGSFIFILMSLLLPKTYKQSNFSNPISQIWSGLKLILKQKAIIIYAILAISVYTPLCILADLWGTVFFMEKFSLSRSSAAQISLCLYAGLTLGSLIVPAFSVKLGKLKETIQLCALGLIVSISVLLYINEASVIQLAFLLILIGFLCGAEMICFTLAVQYAPIKYSGLALGVVNTLNMLGEAIIQQFIGWHLDWRWKGAYAADGTRYYDAAELTTAFSVLILVILVCWIISTRLPKNEFNKIHSQ